MASAAPPNRMVSSVFITLASPYRASLSQPARRPSPVDAVSVLRHRKEDVHLAPSQSQRTSDPSTGPEPAETATGQRTEDSRGQKTEDRKVQRTEESRGQRTEDSRGQKTEDSRGQRTEDSSTAAAPPQRCPLPEDSSPPSPPAQTAASRPLTSAQPPPDTAQVQTGSEAAPGTHHTDASQETKEVCGFCRKRVRGCDPAIQALNRTYHDACFQCRSCHLPLAGKQYYNKAGTPLCDDCYQASLEPCWSCGEVIRDQVIRALERAYHPACFTCATCGRPIGEQAFAQGEVGDVYCLPDYYRKYAPLCSSCQQLIIPREDGTDSYTVECLGRSYHENCYRCEVCVIQLSPEPNERGCHPLDGRMLCRTCHQDLISSQL